MEIEKKQAHHESICKSLTETYVKKNIDYGDSFTDGIDKFGLVSAATRLNDKNNRIGQLITSDKQNVKDESLKDSLLDMANYCIMTVMHMEGDSVDRIEKPVTKPDDLQDILFGGNNAINLADSGYEKINVSTKFQEGDVIVYKPLSVGCRSYIYLSFHNIFGIGGYISVLDNEGISCTLAAYELINKEYYIRKGV